MEGNSINNQKEISVTEAVAQINLILQRIYQEGSFDSEPNQLRQILERLGQNKITPVDALKEASLLESRRQSYH